ncbi:MAG TPA: porin, partial [Opitutaceae bacterium]|nr:porin [Opitutaceae bacterium]
MPLRLHPTLFSVLLAGLTTHAASSQTLSVEERLARLEKEVTTLREENTTLRDRLGISAKPGASVNPIVRAAGQETRLSIGGFLHEPRLLQRGDAPDDRWSGANARDRFLLRRARLGVQGQWKEPVSFKLEADYGNNSLSGKSGYSAQLTDAYATYSNARVFNVRLGQFKTPFGYEQLTSDTKVHTIERSLPNDRLTVGRQIGIGVFGDMLDGRVSYSTGVFNGNGVNNGLNDNDNFLTAGRVAGTLVKTKFQDKAVAFNVGANGYVNKLDPASPTTEREGWGFDAQLSVGTLDLT